MKADQQQADPDKATGTRQLIMQKAIMLFAKSGFSGASMRDLAKAVGITPAALYYHFPDKESLYFESMRFAYAGRAAPFNETQDGQHTPAERLTIFLRLFTQQIYREPDFQRLLQRERLEGDRQRMKLLAEHLFQEQFKGLSDLLQELAPQYDPHLLTISIVGLISYHLETAPVRPYLPGSKAEHDDPNTVADHVIRLLFNGIADE